MNNSLIEIIGYIDSHVGFWNLYWRVSYFLTNLVKIQYQKTFVVYIENPIYRGSIVNPWDLEAEFGNT